MCSGARVWSGCWRCWSSAIRVVWVAATAGAGKTTAVVQAGALHRAAAWPGSRSTRTDAAPGRLVTYLEAALDAPRAAASTASAPARWRGASRTPRPPVCSPRRSATSPLLLVIDELERLADAPDALAVLGGRRPLRAADHAHGAHQPARAGRSTLGTAATLGRVAAVGEADLAFTAEEAARALADARACRGRPDRGRRRPPAAGSPACCSRRGARRTTSPGWAARPTRSTATCPRRSSSSSHPDDREFLIATSLLDEVTPAAAEALGQDAAGDRLVALRAEHLPGDVVARRAQHALPHALPRVPARVPAAPRRPAACAALRAAHGDAAGGGGPPRGRRRGVPARRRARTAPAPRRSARSPGSSNASTWRWPSAGWTRWRDAGPDAGPLSDRRDDARHRARAVRSRRARGRSPAAVGERDPARARVARPRA